MAARPQISYGLNSWYSELQPCEKEDPIQPLYKPTTGNFDHGSNGDEEYLNVQWKGPGVDDAGIDFQDLRLIVAPSAKT